MQLVSLASHTQIGKRELSFCPNVANFIFFVSVCYACFLPLCWATSTSKMDGVFQRVLQLRAKTPVCSNSNPAHLCYSHLSALHSSGGSVALYLRLVSASHLQPQFRTPAGQMLLKCCCKQLCHVIKAQIMWASEVEHPLFHGQPVSAGCLCFCRRLKDFTSESILNFPRISPWAIRTTSGGHSDH